MFRSKKDIEEENRLLRERNAFMEEILDMAPILLFIEQIEKSHNKYSVRNVWMNKRALNYIGYTREEIDQLNDRYFRELIHPEDILKIEGAIDKFKMQTDEQINTGFFRIRHKNGEYKKTIILYSIYKRSEDGLPSHLLNAATGVNNQLLVENQFKEAIKEISRLKNILKSEMITKREREILQLISQGLTDKEISMKIFISLRTVKTHRYKLLKKVGVNNTAALVAFAVECGLN